MKIIRISVELHENDSLVTEKTLTTLDQKESHLLNIAMNVINNRLRGPLLNKKELDLINNLKEFIKLLELEDE